MLIDIWNVAAFVTWKDPKFSVLESLLLSYILPLSLSLPPSTPALRESQLTDVPSLKEQLEGRLSTGWAGAGGSM